MTTEFKLYVLPISGGAFPVQLGLLSILFDVYKINKPTFTGSRNYSPDLILGASGGNVSGYIGMAGDWYYEGICRIVENIDSNMFIRSWWPDDLDFIPTWFLTIFTGTIFRPGYGPENLLSVAFPGKLIENNEILTLAFNSTKYVPQIFSNKSKETSILPTISETDKLLFNLKDIQYLNGNVQEISKACMASAAIPIVTQSQVINNEKYDDGGLTAASPLSILTEEMYNIITKNNKLLHLIYFSCYDMDDEDKSKIIQYRGAAQVTISCMVHSKTLQDRASAVGLVSKLLGRECNYTNFTNASIQKLAECFEQNKDNHYVIELYPKGAPNINLTNFKNNDVIDLINSTRKLINFSIWN